MIKHWTRFPGRPHGRFRRDGVRVTMGPKGVIYMNEKAWDELGRPEAVEMMYDKLRRTIGLIPSDPDVPEAFPVKDKPGTRGKVISASAFCTHFLIKMMRTGLFNEVEVDSDGVMSLSLDTISAVSRGAR
jgi:hypothetical protein